MADVPAKFFSLFFTSLASKEINLFTDQAKLMLCPDTYTPNQDTHRYKSAVTAEISAPGYIAGGQSVGPITSAYNASTNKWSFDGVDALWTGFTGVARWGVLYIATPATDATRPLVGFVDFLENRAATASNFSVGWNAAGIGEITVG